MIEVEGPPRERGIGYGRAAADRIVLGVGHYAAQLASLGLAWPRVGDLARSFLPAIEAFGPHYLAEMQGIAAGAGVDVEAIALLNCRTEILELGARGGSLPADTGGEGCTGVVVYRPATAEARLMHAQNWDWKAECAETAVVLKIHRDDGPDILTFTEAGGLARSGLNAAGIAITANYLESDRDWRRIGVPLPLIRRKVLEQQHYALALHVIHTTPKSGSNNMMLSHRDGLALDLECAPDETFVVHADRGVLVHANHWQSPVALAKLRDTGIANAPDSLYRDVRVRELLAPRHGTLTRADVVAALADDFGSPWSVCRPVAPELAGNLSATVAMIVMEPADRAMDVAMLPAGNCTFQSYRLDPVQR